MMDRALLSVALREHRKELEREEASDLRDLQDLNGGSAGSSSTVKTSRKQKHEQKMSTSLKPKQLQQQVTGNTSTQDGVVAAPKKRKKISRACNNCQVAHLTCSTSRPCVRCIKRGLQDSCQDGARKKAKYLLDVEDDLVNAGKAHPTNFLPSNPADSSLLRSGSEDEDTKVDSSSFNSAGYPHQPNPGFSTTEMARHSVSPLVSTSALVSQNAEDASALDSVINALTTNGHLGQNGSGEHNLLGRISEANANTNNNFLTPFANLNDFDLSNDFGSSSANLEYAVLSSMLQNSGYGNFSPANFSSNLPALSMDNFANGQAGTSYGMADFPSLQTGYSDSANQVSPPGAPFNSTSNASQSMLGSSQGQVNRHKSNSTSNGQTPYAFSANSFDGCNYLSTSGQLNGENGRSAFLNSEVASLFGGLAQDQLTQSPTQVDQYGQQHSTRPHMQHFDSAASYTSHQLTPQSDTTSTPQSQQQSLPQSQQQQQQDAHSSIRPSYSPMSNPNGGSLTSSTKSFSSALDWNNTKPSAGLAAPAGPSRALPQRQASLHSLLNSTQRQQLKQSQAQFNRGQVGGQQQQQQPSQSGQQSAYQQQQQQQFAAPSGGGSRPVRTSSRPMVSSTGIMRVEDVYKHVNKPYNYLEAYHALIRHLQTNFDSKSDVRRIIRALSVYRPSLIALQMPLSVDDEIFIERSFQRTLIELEKLISFSGTPTVVWRRTGEIMLVGTEFSMLSEWKRDQLLCRDRDADAGESGDGRNKVAKPKRRYIFEIFDQKSCVEYYESFAAHAFESSTSTIMQTCTLVTPKGRKVPCTFAYTIKRDIFGLPNRVIGQFLPILTNDI